MNQFAVRASHLGKVWVGLAVMLAIGLVALCPGYILYVVGRVVHDVPLLVLLSVFVVWLKVGAHKRHRTPRLWLGVLLLCLVIAVDARFGPLNWRAAFRREKFVRGRAEALKATVVSPHLEAEIAAGSNILWCGTFQLAWNELCDLTGGDVQFDRNPSMVASLNKRLFTKESIDDASYVALAGLVKDDIQKNILSAIQQKFQGAFRPCLVPDKALTPHPNDIVAYACLRKSLSFPVPFEQIEKPLTFAGVRVRSFGIASRYKPGHLKMYPEVLIRDYRSEDDFVIELKTQTPGDRLILAKIPAHTNLLETVASVQTRVGVGQGASAETNDILEVPRIKFDLTREYSEIEGRLLIPKSPTASEGLQLSSAVQNTRFELNEKGAVLESEAHVLAMGCANPVSVHRMIFDKPFLVLLCRSGAPMPYFALWVGSPELLVGW